MKNLIIGAIQNARPDRVTLIDGARYELLTKCEVIRIVNEVSDMHQRLKQNGTQL